jgi:hypothetical protein
MKQRKDHYLKDAAVEALDVFRALTREEYGAQHLLAGLILLAKDQEYMPRDLFIEAELIAADSEAQTVYLGGTKGGAETMEDDRKGHETRYLDERNIPRYKIGNVDAPDIRRTTGTRRDRKEQTNGK